MTSLSVTDLDHDVMFHILSYLTASDLDFGLSLTSKAFHQECSSPTLWKALCERTGKSERILGWKCDSFFDLYHRIPCVPQDFPSISLALDACPVGGTITLLPGVYEERVVISKSVRIRAADIVRGAALVWQHRSDPMNQSAIEIDDSCSYVSLHHLNILHYSNGSDIWAGNCALFCHGNLTHTVVNSCSIQSDSGRGVVVTNGASLKLVHSTVHDCAATGLYVGGMDTILEISNCNVIRNGFGLPPAWREAQDPAMTLVTSGHSGLYVEAAEAEIRNTLLAENCLTGLSVVRHGTVHICESDITGNGEEPIAVFEELSESAEGGVYEHSNNFETQPLETPDDRIRSSGVYHKFLTKSIIDQIYSA